MKRFAFFLAVAVLGSMIFAPVVFAKKTDLQDEASVAYVSALAATSGTYGEMINRAALSPEARKEFLEYAKEQGILGSRVLEIRSWGDTFFLDFGFGRTVRFSYESKPRKRLNFSGFIVTLEGKSLERVRQDVDKVLLELLAGKKSARLLDLIVARAVAADDAGGKGVGAFGWLASVVHPSDADTVKAAGLSYKCVDGRMTSFGNQEEGSFVVENAIGKNGKDVVGWKVSQAKSKSSDQGCSLTFSNDEVPKAQGSTGCNFKSYPSMDAEARLAHITKIPVMSLRRFCAANPNEVHEEGTGGGVSPTTPTTNRPALN